MLNKHISKHIMDFINDYFGDKNDIVTSRELKDINDELDAMDDEFDGLDDNDIFNLTMSSIYLGKPQILELLLTKFTYTKNEINKIKDRIEDFAQINENEHELIKEFNDILKDYSKIPYHKKR
jgi:hypothetical protein